VEVEDGDQTALWVFDSRDGPDGYLLRGHIVELARRERLRLVSFGPRAAAHSRLAACFALVPESDRAFARRLSEKLAEAALACRAELYLVGSAKGTYAGSIPSGAAVWEVQHGLLDPSYFPISAKRFFARSGMSAALLRDRAPGVIVTALSDDLAPPCTKPCDPALATSVVCYSKNPGGGCTAAELARFERSVRQLAAKMELPFQIKQHPRDRKTKLACRHRGLWPLRHLGPPAAAEGGRRLVVSSFSTALTSETRSGDLLMNVAISPPDPVVASEYGWLPSVTIDELATGADLPIVERL
jgi:hypothetical protein